MKQRVFIRSALLASAALIAAGLDNPVWAQPAQMTVGQAVYHDTSPRIDRTPSPSPAQGGANRQIPIRNRGNQGRFPDLTAPDGGLQSQTSAGSALGPTPPPGISFQGLGDDDNAATIGHRYVPPDTNGDIGLDGSGNRIYIQYINTIWAIYNAATGARVGPVHAGNSVWQGFGGFCQNNDDGDPVVLYDDLAGRWVFSQFSINQGVQCMAVSVTSDPLGSYYRYAFTVTPGGNNDYPKLGVWSDGTTGSAGQSAYTFTTRDFGGAGGPFSLGAGVMERDQMLVGGAAQFVKFSNPCTGIDCIEGQLPPHLAGSPPPAGTCPTFWSAVDAAYDDSPYASDGYRNHRLCVDWSNLGNSSYAEGPLVVAGSNFDRFLGSNGFSDCIGPVNGGEVLDCLASFTMYRAQYRWFGTYGSVVLNTTVDAGGDRAGIRWAETRSVDGDTGWYLQQDGTYAPDDGLERWMGSVAQDQDGNIALGYSATGSALFPSVRYTSRSAGDPAGTMPGGEASCIEGTGAQIASYNRWGDYSSMSVDPADDCTFWYTQEYYETTGSFDFNTRICSFMIEGCGGSAVNDPPVVTITAPADGSSYTEGDNVDFSGTAMDTEDLDISANLNWTSSLDGAIGNGAGFSTSSLSVGTHTITAIVTDSGGKSGSAIITVIINAAPPVNVHVASVVTGTVSATRGQKYGTATVTIANNLGQPASGYTVSGDFGGSFSESASGGPTNSNGQITLQTTTAQKGPTVTFCVSAVTGGSLPYEESKNAPGVTCAQPPPVVTITSPADGSIYDSGATIDFSGTAVDAVGNDLSGDINWTSGLDGNIGVGASFTTTLNDGTHIITASVTDSGGQAGSDTITVVVGTPASTIMHVGDLDGSSVQGSNGRWNAVVAIAVHDATHSPLSGATVNGSWSNGANGSGSCVTDATGLCSVTKSNLKLSGFTFSVTGVSRTGDSYDSGANHDPDGDSDGTATTLP